MWSMETHGFKGMILLRFLGHARPGKAIIDHIPEQFKQSYEGLISGVGIPKTRPLAYNDKNTIYINEAGLYRLIFTFKE